MNLMEHPNCPNSFLFLVVSLIILGAVEFADNTLVLPSTSTADIFLIKVKSTVALSIENIFSAALDKRKRHVI